MKIREILLQMPQDALEALARTKLSQVTDIRLPHAVLVDELTEVLGSSAYVSVQVRLRHPPCYSILSLLMNAPDYSLSAEGFRQQVQEETERMIALASRKPIFPKGKNYDLYLKMMSAAWEYEQDINPSEANLLRVLREELGISLMEHFVIEHHPDLHRFWRTDQAYENERNHLRSAGVLFSVEGRHILPEEIVVLIRRAWGMELSHLQFLRLLDAFSNEDLRNILDAEGLNVSGTADEKKNRILENYVLPRASLEQVHIESLRAAARSLGCRPYGAKDEVIENILDWLDTDEDLKAKEAAAAEQEVNWERVPEPKQLTTEAFTDLLRRLTNESLYDVLSRLSDLRKSGSKDERAKRLAESPYSEETILRNVNNSALYDVCRELRLNPYGPKEEKIARLIEAYRHFNPQTFQIAVLGPTTQKSEGNSGASTPPAAPPDAQLPRLAAVRTEFPFLTEAEQIVLGYLLDFKSISDTELDKLVQRFALPWVLTKAQMDDLIKNLRANGRDIIRVRGLADHNIYELVS